MAHGACRRPSRPHTTHTPPYHLHADTRCPRRAVAHRGLNMLQGPPAHPHALSFLLCSQYCAARCRCLPPVGMDPGASCQHIFIELIHKTRLCSSRHIVMCPRPGLRPLLGDRRSSASTARTAPGRACPIAVMQLAGTCLTLPDPRNVLGASPAHE